MIDVLASQSIADSCRRWPERPAITYGATTMLYAELGARISALAAWYRSLGIASGDRIVCQAPPCPEHVIAMAAAWAVGAVHVGAHPDLTGAELVSVLDETDAAALVCRPRSGDDDARARLDVVRAARPRSQIIVHHEQPRDGEQLLEALLHAPPGASAGTDGDPIVDDGPAVMLRTSGTTGAPKTVVETLPALWAKAVFFAEMVRAGADDVHLLMLPMSHAYGMTLSLCALATGGRLVLAERFSPEQSLQLVGDERVSILPGSPTHFTLLLRALDPARHRVDTLRCAVSAAAPFPASLADDIYARLGVEIMHVYGCSEGFLTATRDRDAIRAGSAGSRVFRGPPGTPPDGSVAILDMDRNVRLPAASVGEIAYGAARPVRYWREQPLATDGWYRTGDLGFIDADGRVFVSGRIKELVNRGGLKVACREVEQALQDLPAVADCGVFPSPDAVLGEAICACVVPTAGQAPTLDEVRSWLGAVLARHKLPDELHLVREIPRTSLGKIDRTALIAQVAGSDPSTLPLGAASAAPRI